MMKEKNTFQLVMSYLVPICAIVGCIATVLVVPEFRRWSGLEQSTSPEIPTQTSAQLPLATNAEILAQPPIQATATFQLPARSIGHRQIANNGTEDLILASNQVTIGTADKFQDLLQYDYPPFTIFVIYGETNVQLSLYWGGWDLWENASDSFIEEQIHTKIQEVIDSHPNDYDKRGYRVIKCYGQVVNCETITTFP